jgi:hypothetical protein
MPACVAVRGCFLVHSSPQPVLLESLRACGALEDDRCRERGTTGTKSAASSWHCAQINRFLIAPRPRYALIADSAAPALIKAASSCSTCSVTVLGCTPHVCMLFRNTFGFQSVANQSQSDQSVRM